MGIKPVITGFWTALTVHGCNLWFGKGVESAGGTPFLPDVARTTNDDRCLAGPLGNRPASRTKEPSPEMGMTLTAPSAHGERRRQEQHRGRRANGLGCGDVDRANSRNAEKTRA